MKKVSKSKAKLGQIMIILGGIGCLMCNMTMDLTMWVCALAVLLIGLVLYIQNNRCPRCGTTLFGTTGAAAKAGYCHKCGAKLDIGK